MLVLIGVLVLTFPSITFAKKYVLFTGGNGGDTDASSWGVDLGGFSTGRDLNHFGGFGASYILNGSGSTPSDVLDWSCPHNDYTELETVRNNESALFGKYGLELVKNKRLFIFVLAGFSTFTKKEYVQSNATGWYYEQSSRSYSYNVFGGGIAYFSVESKLSIQVSHDNRRGISVGVGFHW